jgi:branched-chain amino acid transport system permease protein
MSSKLALTLRTNWLPALILIALIVFPHLVGWLTDSSPFGMQRGARVVMTGRSVYWQSVAIEVFIFCILAMSYNLVFGFSGVVTFGHALFFGAGGYSVAILLERTDLHDGQALLIGILLGLGLCALFALIMGFASLRLRGVYFAIFTLALAEMAFIYTNGWAFVDGETGFSISTLPDWINPTVSRLNYYYVSLALFAFSFLAIRRLIYSPTGAVLLAIRENEDRAQSIGYATFSYKLFAILVSALMAGSAGILLALLNKTVSPALLGVGYTLEPLLMTIIGGIGTFSGPIIGAVGLHLLNSQLRDSVITIGSTEIAMADLWGIILGGIFIVVVLIFPQGIVGTWARWRARRSRPQAADQPGVTAAQESQIA